MNALAEKFERLERYTYADYLTWDEDIRCELIRGVPQMMAAPSGTHQTILGNLHIDLGSFLRGKQCQVFVAPYDVRLNATTWDDIVVQPDIVVVCDRSKTSDSGCKGAPDLIIEVLSPSSTKHDRITKMQLYKDAGVREYWIVDPKRRAIEVHVLESGERMNYFYGKANSIPVHVLDGFEIPMENIFDKVPNSGAW